MNILITGTSSGIGFGLAKFYLEQNHTVFGISRKPNAELNQHQKFHFLPQDLSRFNETAANIIEFLKEVNTLDLVVLNAGVVNEIKDLKDTSLHEIQKVMDINVWANKVLKDILLKEIQHIHQIVAISSAASNGKGRGWNAYSLSKATLNTQIQLYASENFSTHFCSLAPGPVDTKIQDYIFSLEEDERFPSVYALKKSKASDQMIKTSEAARNISLAIQKAKLHPSGSFLNVKELLVTEKHIDKMKKRVKYALKQFRNIWLSYIIVLQTNHIQFEGLNLMI